MDKAQIIAHAKAYMDLLSQGVDPISKEKITADSVTAQPRLQKCFAFISEILAELLENDGFVALSSDAVGRYRVYEKKANFSLGKEQIRFVRVSSRPITVGAFVKNINEAVDTDRMNKLSMTAVNVWLLANGYVVESKELATIRKTVRRPSEKSAEIGLQEQETLDTATGEIKRQMVFTSKAQMYILDHLDEVAKSR